ncbi:hypothetical protein L1987_79668 [Smallanthus sonchifolius]|uniref:Uncharacterized protein n=1 Tax=Smallanthus sonchifolius TaxID=185202 RepID=A0ACB8YKZ5_9ASTR|nr:hypothetical protein L1987_79668 [Smallanthus sonchifolius]
MSNDEGVCVKEIEKVVGRSKVAIIEPNKATMCLLYIKEGQNGNYNSTRHWSTKHLKSTQESVFSPFPFLYRKIETQFIYTKIKPQS